MIITIKYPCKYRLSFAQNYVFSGDKCFNSKTNREIKQVYDFLIEASMMSGLVDPGKININKNIVKSRTTKKIIEKGTKTKEEDENKYII